MCFHKFRKINKRSDIKNLWIVQILEKKSKFDIKEHMSLKELNILLGIFLQGKKLTG